MNVRSALPIGLTVCLLAWPAGGLAAPDCVLEWTTEASGAGSAPADFSGVAVGPAGHIYVTDAAAHQVLMFSVNGTLLRTWGAPGYGAGEFRSPSGIAVDGLGFVYVADAFNHRIQKFTSNGAFVKAWGGPGTEPGCFHTVSAVAVDASGFVYAADLGNHRIQKFTSEGTPVAVWASGGPLPDESGTGRHHGHFQRESLAPRGVGLVATLAGQNGPIDLAVDAGGTVYVLDGAHLRVERFAGDGTPLRVWDLDPLGVTAPTGITASSNGTVFVTDIGSGRVVMATPNGWFLDAWSEFDGASAGTTTGGHRGDHFQQYSTGAGAPAAEAGRLRYPGAATVDALDRILVVEAGAVLGFQYPSPPSRMTAGVYPWHAANVCPTWSSGHIPIGVLGHVCLPVQQVDLSSLVLAGAGSPEGYRFRDVGRPGTGDACPEQEGDGCCDLILEFHGEQILEAAGWPEDGALGEVTVVGRRLDGTPIWGTLTVEIQRFKPGGSRRVPGHFTRVTYSVPEAAPVRIAMYDVTGRFLGRIVDEVQAAGGYELAPPRSGLPGGVYFLRIEIGSRVETRKLIVVP